MDLRLSEIRKKLERLEEKLRDNNVSSAVFEANLQAFKRAYQIEDLIIAYGESAIPIVNIIENIEGDLVMTQNSNSNNNNITTGSNNTNSTVTTGNVSVNSWLSEVSQNINDAPALKTERKRDLINLVDQLKICLDPFKESNPDEVGSILQHAQNVISLVTKEKVNAKLTGISLRGLRDAADYVSDTIVSAKNVVSQIIEFVRSLIAPEEIIQLGLGT